MRYLLLSRRIAAVKSKTEYYQFGSTAGALETLANRVKTYKRFSYPVHANLSRSDLADAKSSLRSDFEKHSGLINRELARRQPKNCTVLVDASNPYGPRVHFLTRDEFDTLKSLNRRITSLLAFSAILTPVVFLIENAGIGALASFFGAGAFMLALFITITFEKKIDALGYLSEKRYKKLLESGFKEVQKEIGKIEKNLERWLPGCH